MNNFLIFKDENTTVEIDGVFHQFLKATQPQFVELEDREFKFVLSLVISTLKEKIGYIKEEDNKLIGNIPIIKSGHALVLKEPYDCFNDILHYLCLFSNLDENIDEIMNDVNECFEEEGFYCYIFPHKIFDVKGFITHKEGDKQIIMMFGFKENNQNLDFLENL